MDLATFAFEEGAGWSVPSFPALDSPQTLVLVFGAAGFGDSAAPFSELAAAYPQARIVGCSGAGEIHGEHISDRSLSVAVMRFEKTALRVASASVNDGAGSTDAGASLGRALASPDLRAVFVLSDGLSVNGTELLAGILANVGRDVVVTGGLAGDGSRFKKTWVIHEGVPRSGWVVAVGLYGDAIHVTHGSRGGWSAFGPERLVTRSEGNVLYALDDQPALALYKKYLGDRASGLPATALLFPLAILQPGSRDVVVRTILSVDEENQSMTFAGDIPQDAVVQLMRANVDRLVDGASEASAAAARQETGQALTVAISCVGRRLVLGERAEEELEAVLDGTRDPLVGFYSYGEISPLVTGTCAVLHNQTMTLTRFWES